MFTFSLHFSKTEELINMVKNWFKLVYNSRELQLVGTLNGGQSFRWKKVENENFPDKWIGIFAGKVWLLQEESDNSLLYQVFEPENTKHKQTQETYNKLLSDYFQLDVDLKECYEKWGKNDQYFREAAKQFYGIRILKQDVTENIFSFICSQNNHISRISSMVEKLAEFYGDRICDIDGKTYYSFPKVEALANPSTEQKLRTHGFGYRAKYISHSAKTIVEHGGETWLEELKNMKYEDAKKQLMTLMGIGAKVADCICLMSLGHLEALPVDTHVFQIAQRLYLPKLTKQKTVTERIYKEIGDYFRDLYGPLAGWAHTVLFCADLKMFQSGDKKIEKVNEDNTRKNAKIKKQKTR